MDKFKLRTFDGIALAGFLILPWLFYTGPGELIKYNNSAAWITLLLAFTIMLCLFLILSSLMKRYEKKNIIEITSIVMGRPFGIIYGIALSIYFCYFTGVQIREGAEILKIYGMNLTPLYIVAGLILLTAVIMNFFGGKAVVKSASFFFIIIIIGIVSALLLALNGYNPDYLFPVLGNGVSSIAKNSLTFTSVIDGVILLFIFAPAFSGTAAMKKSGVIAITLTAGLSIITCICYIMMFNPIVASTMMSGFIEMGKSSYYNHFFYRFESGLLFFLIFSSLMTASIGIFIAKESIGRTFNFKRPKTVTVICSMLAAVMVFIPADILELKNKYLFVIRHYSVFFIAGFPLLVFIINSIKRLFKYEKN